MMPARYFGVCQSCEGEIHPGDMVRPGHNGRGWEHARHATEDEPDLQPPRQTRTSGQVCPECFTELSLSGACACELTEKTAATRTYDDILRLEAIASAAWDAEDADELPSLREQLEAEYDAHAAYHAEMQALRAERAALDTIPVQGGTSGDTHTSAPQHDPHAARSDDPTLETTMTQPAQMSAGGPWTSHGHPVPGITVAGPGQPPVMRCGGPGFCAQCNTEANQLATAAQQGQQSLSLDAARMAQVQPAQQPQAPAAPEGKSQPRVYQPPEGSRLAELLALWPDTYERSVAAKEAMEDLRSQVKAEIDSLGLVRPGEPPVTVTGPVPLVARKTEGRKLEGSRLQAEYPEVWQLYSKPSVTYDLRAAK